jgi:hypothetical protein
MASIISINENLGISVNISKMAAAAYGENMAA